MKVLSVIAALSFMFIQIQGNAQTETPKGYTKGIIILSDSSSLTGYIKDNIRKNASIKFTLEENGKSKTYNGFELQKLQIGDNKFICINGNFFKILEEGQLDFLQKANSGASKIIYNGSEPVLVNGGEGNINDYFLYAPETKKLTIVSNKNLSEVINSVFKSNSKAKDRAGSVGNDLALLKDAVILFNQGK